MNKELVKKIEDSILTGCDNYPSLSELINACGKSFKSLENPVDDEWFAEAKEREEKDFCPTCKTRTIEPIMAHGDTPEEAVANLLLKLNKNN